MRLQNIIQKKYYIISLIQFVLASLFFLLVVFFLYILPRITKLTAGDLEGFGFIAIMIFPFYVVFVIINIIITLYLFISGGKKEKILSILSLIFSTSFVWILFG